ncbi:hypothetical protein [Winogradskyella poriferorum]|uniref:hypothetical protein n=1 Tax=Winogradskyella poriferorum TaxID=307627 RepID=UPI003D65B490
MPVTRVFSVESERLTSLFYSDSEVANTTAWIYNPHSLKEKTQTSELDGFSILIHNTVVSVVESERV